jgi:hypothetical protein
LKTAAVSRTEQNRTEQNRTEQNRTEQNRTEQNRTEQNYRDCSSQANRTELQQNRTFGQVGKQKHGELVMKLTAYKMN